MSLFPKLFFHKANQSLCHRLVQIKQHSALIELENSRCRRNGFYSRHLVVDFEVPHVVIKSLMI